MDEWTDTALNGAYGCSDCRQADPSRPGDTGISENYLQDQPELI
jgi:hypothetical protein